MSSPQFSVTFFFRADNFMYTIADMREREGNFLSWVLDMAIKHLMGRRWMPAEGYRIDCVGPHL